MIVSFFVSYNIGLDIQLNEYFIYKHSIQNKDGTLSEKIDLLKSVLFLQ